MWFLLLSEDNECIWTKRATPWSLRGINTLVGECVLRTRPRKAQLNRLEVLRWTHLNSLSPYISSYKVPFAFYNNHNNLVTEREDSTQLCFREKKGEILCRVMTFFFRRLRAQLVDLPCEMWQEAYGQIKVYIASKSDILNLFYVPREN